jgi:hypothetical protein
MGFVAKERLFSANMTSFINAELYTLSAEDTDKYSFSPIGEDSYGYGIVLSENADNISDLSIALILF